MTLLIAALISIPSAALTIWATEHALSWGDRQKQIWGRLDG